MKKHLLFFSFLIILFPLTAQPLCQIEYFTANNGLSQGVITAILQDQKGFMWFPGDGCMLTNNRIVFITESK